MRTIPLGFVAKAYHEHPRKAGDVLDGYVPVEPYEAEVRPGVIEWEQHPHEMPFDGWEDWRDESAHFCTCGYRLVRILVATDGLRWAHIKQERIPKAARRPDHDFDDDDTMTPLHNDQLDGMPCVVVSSCRRCPKRWLVLIYEDGVELVEARLVRHGIVVRP